MLGALCDNGTRRSIIAVFADEKGAAATCELHDIILWIAAAAATTLEILIPMRKYFLGIDQFERPVDC